MLSTRKGFAQSCSRFGHRICIEAERISGEKSKKTRLREWASGEPIRRVLGEPALRSLEVGVLWLVQGKKDIDI